MPYLPSSLSHPDRSSPVERCGRFYAGDMHLRSGLYSYFPSILPVVVLQWSPCRACFRWPTFGLAWTSLLANIDTWSSSELHFKQHATLADAVRVFAMPCCNVRSDAILETNRGCANTHPGAPHRADRFAT